MAAPPTLDTFRQAVVTFCTTTDQQQRQTVSQWLEHFERSDQAWTIATTALTDPETTAHPNVTQIRTFATQTLRHKINRDLYMLSPDAITQLRHAILELLAHPQQNPLPVAAVTQLCSALAGMAIHAPQGVWQDPVGTICSHFGNRPDLTTTYIEFLTVLPEDLLASERLFTREEFADKFSSLIEAHSPQLFSSLVSSLQNAGAADFNVKRKLFACIESWMTTQTIPLDAITSSSIVPMSFSALESTDDALFESAISILCEIFDRAMQDVQNELNSGYAVVMQATPHLVRIAPLINAAADDEERARGMVRLVTAACNALLPLICTQPQQFREVLQLMLKVTSYESLYDAITPSFDFWYYLSESLLGSNPGGSTQEFNVIYLELVDILVRQLRYPNDLDGWSARDRDDFREFRHTVGQVLKNCIHVLTENTLLNKFLGMLQRPGAEWQDTEAVLFALRTVGNVVHPEEATIMPQIMSALPVVSSQPGVHPKIRYAVLQLLGCYSHWTSRHPDHIAPQMTLISGGFGEPQSELCIAATRALKYLAQDCATHLHPYLKDLHAFYCSAHTQLPLDETVGITEAIGHIIAVAPAQEIPPLMQMFATPLVQLLQQPGDQPVLQLKGVLYRLAAFIRVVQPSSPRSSSAPQPNGIASAPTPAAVQSAPDGKPVLDLMDALWPFLEQVLERHGTEDPITEGVAKILRSTLTPVCVEKYTMPQLQRLVNLLAQQYDRTHLSCWIWVANHVVSQFSRNPQCATALLEFVSALAQGTVRFLERDGFGEAYEAVDELYGLLATLLNEMPEATLRWSPTLERLVQLAVSTVEHCDHPRTLSSTVYFLYELAQILMPAKRKPHVPPLNGADAECVQRCIVPIGASMVRVLMWRRCVDDVIPAESIQDVASVLYYLAGLCPAQWPAWSAAAIQNLTFLNAQEAQSCARELERTAPQIIGNGHEVSSSARTRELMNRVALLHRRRVGLDKDDRDRRRR